MNVERIAWVRRLARNGQLRAIREGAGFSVASVARELRVSPSTVWRWENGDRLPRDEVAERYARLLQRLSAW